MSSKKGISSILGTLIFIGVLFSAVAPMFVMMRQADVYYEIEKQELTIKDIERLDETLIMYGYGEGEGSTELTVYVQNRGAGPVVIKRVWLNNDYETVSTPLAPGNSTTLGPFDVTGTSLRLKISTANGNIFPCDLGTLSWSEANGWYTPSLGISVHVLNDKGKYDIRVNNTLAEEIGSYTSTDQEDGDITKTFLIGDTDSPCSVTVKKKKGGGWETLLNQLEVVVPSSGNYIVHVVVDGR